MAQFYKMWFLHPEKTLKLTWGELRDYILSLPHLPQSGDLHCVHTPYTSVWSNNLSMYVSKAGILPDFWQVCITFSCFALLLIVAEEFCYSFCCTNYYVTETKVFTNLRNCAFSSKFLFLTICQDGFLISSNHRSNDPHLEILSLQERPWACLVH